MNKKIKKNLLDLKHTRAFNAFITLIILTITSLSIAVSLILAYKENSVSLLIVFSIIDVCLLTLAFHFYSRSNEILAKIEKL